MYNVLIRPLAKEDAFTSYQWRNDPEIWTFTGSRPNIEITKEIETDWIQKVLADDSSKRFAILCDNQYIGNVQLTNINDSTAEFHIFIGDKNFWGKGISQLATYQILYYAKEVLKLSEIYLSVKPENISAIESYKRNNFIIVEEDSDNIKMLLQLSNLKNTTVSIFVMVYNHGQFLKDCLDSLLKQKTNFNFDIVIGEDHSKDDSRKILLNYQNLYPGKFKLLLHKENIGAANNQHAVYQNCLGKYIAICEGDDYWTDPLKLQKQVDFLEKNSDYSIVFHKVSEINSSETQNKTILNGSDIEETYSIDDLAKGNLIHTPSVLFKKNFEELPQWFQYSPIGDYPLHMLNADYGLIKYLPEQMAAYRVGEGIWSSKSSVYRIVNTMFTLTFLISHFSHNEKIKNILRNQYSNLTDLLSGNQGKLTNVHIERALYNFPYKKILSILLKKLKYSIRG